MEERAGTKKREVWFALLLRFQVADLGVECGTKLGRSLFDVL